MKSIKRIVLPLVVFLFLLIFFFASGPLYIVREGNQAVVTRFGSIAEVRTDAGLYFKIPAADMVTTYPKRILSIDGDPQRIPTKENQFIVVDTTSRWKIADPKLFYTSFKTIENASNRLSDIIDSATRTVVTANRLSEIVRSSNIINERAAKAAGSSSPGSSKRPGPSCSKAGSPRYPSSRDAYSSSGSPSYSSSTRSTVLETTDTFLLVTPSGQEVFLLVRRAERKRPLAHPEELTYPCCLPTLGELGEVPPREEPRMSVHETEPRRRPRGQAPTL